MEHLELGLGLDIIRWFESWRSPAVEAFFGPFNPLGGTLFYLLLLPLLYWCINASFGRRALLTFLGVVWLNMSLKGWWARPRPFQVSSAVHPMFIARGPGLPSGHAMMATTLWGMVAATVRRRWVTALLVLFIFLMGTSRMVAGVHYPQDVLVGWLLGGLAVVFFVWAEPPLVAWIRARSLGGQLGLAATTTLAMLAVFRLFSPFGAPVYRHYAIMLAGMFLGSGVGFALEQRWVGFRAQGRLLHRGLRLLSGGAVLLGMFFALRRLGHTLDDAPLFVGLVSLLVGYAVLGLWLSLGAPWLFVRLGWAPRDTPPH